MVRLSTSPWKGFARLHVTRIALACAGCLVVTAATASAQVGQLVSPGPLSKAHAALEGGAACQRCHEPGRKVTAARCLACHKPIADRIREQRGVHRDVAGDCVGCHVEHMGVDAELRPLDVRAFDHAAETGFVLDGRHAALARDCAKCHKTRSFLTAVPSCGACHADPHKGSFKQDCAACHSETNFKKARFDHDSTKFPLRDKHAGLACAACHKSLPRPTAAGRTFDFRGLQTGCASCHSDPHRGELGTACETCHTPATFKVPSFTHANLAAFMTGTHATQPCGACHRPETRDYPAGRGIAVRYRTGTGCASCHADQHQGQMGAECVSCHTPKSWRVVSRAFHKTGAFPLEGRHLTVECSSCHLNGAIKGTPVRCVDCHWIRRQDDRYRTRLGVECERCHRPVAWTAVNWNHGTNTGVPLSLVHQALGCDGCHTNQNFQRGGVTCVSCHAAAYQAARNPNHVAAGFPTACDVCHRASHSSWSQTTFTHDGYFPLTGAHATQACSACHRNNVYRGTPRDCIGCHRTTYDRTTSPNHAAAGFPTTCESCHRGSDTSWRTGFNHAAIFPLLGRHASAACTACHANNVYRGTPRDCVGCHRANYDRTTSPNHAAAGFPTTCESCHRGSDTSWRTGFNHAAIFPLLGRHASAACTTCHANNVYRGTPRDCIGCHRATYDRTTRPNHAAAGFPTACEQCHSASASTWSASFDHNRYFQLLGRHLQATCNACHANNVYRGTPRDCIGCHRATYDRTTSPNHAAAGFPTACEQCHSASASTWSASFDHNRYFQLLGRHLQATCNACHRNNVYRGTPRECYPCHQTQYDRATGPNHRAAGFPTTCDTCHRGSDTSWNQGRFNHTWFPITSGKHAGRACAECHQDPNNYRVFQCTTACHTRSKMDDEHRGRAGYRYDSAACYSCHPTGRAD
jgi:hypothetical protein